MPAPATFSGYKLIRDLWPQKSIYDEIVEGSPSVGLISKDTNFGERIRYIGVGTSGPQGIAGTFGPAKEFKNASTAEEFQVQKRSIYGNFSIEGLLWRTYEFTGNKAIIVDPMARESRLMFRNMRNDIAAALHGDGTGAIGRMTSGSTPAASATITLDTGSDQRKFSRKMALHTSPNTSNTNPNPGFVIINQKGGTLSAPTIVVESATWAAGIPGVAASDYIFRAGTYNNVLFQGFDAWFPNHAGSPTAFLNVTRANDAFALAGWLVDGTRMTPRQRILRASVVMADGFGRMTHYMQSTRNWEMLANELEAAGRLKLSKVPAANVGTMKLGVTYEGIEMVGPQGPITIVADPFMPDTVERGFNLETLKIASLGDLIHWDKGATPEAPMLEDAADSREVRSVGDAAFYSEAPGHAVRVAVTAPV